jgi:hypothetical protein
MAASTSTAVPSTVFDDVSRLCAVVDRITKDVEDYTSQYENQYKLVEALGIERNKPENKNALDILALRLSRLDKALDRETKAIANLTNCRVAQEAAFQAQAAVLAATIGGATTTTMTTTTPTTASDKKVMKWKLPEPRDGWKDASGKTHKVHLDAITYHKTLLVILWQIMDIVHHQSTGGSTPTPDVPLARLVPFDTL